MYKSIKEFDYSPMKNYHVIVECNGYNDDDKIKLIFKHGNAKDTIITQFDLVINDDDDDYILNHDDISNIVDDVEDIYGFILFWPNNTLYIVYMKGNEMKKTKLCTIEKKSPQSDKKHLFSEIQQIINSIYPLCIIYRDLTVEYFYDDVNPALIVISNIFSLWLEFEIAEKNMSNFKDNFRNLDAGLKIIQMNLNVASKTMTIPKILFNLLEEIKKSYEKIVSNGYIDSEQSFQELFYDKLGIMEITLRSLPSKNK